MAFMVLMILNQNDRSLQPFVSLSTVLRFCSLPKIGGFAYQDQRYPFLLLLVVCLYHSCALSLLLYITFIDFMHILQNIAKY